MDGQKIGFGKPEVLKKHHGRIGVLIGISVAVERLAFVVFNLEGSEND